MAESPISPGSGGPATARRATPLTGPLRGSVFAPGDKSISHRALIMAAIANGETTIRGLLDGDDILRTAAAMRELGARVERVGEAAGGVWRVSGSAWRSPEKALYFGNSGTGCRLVMGAAAGQLVSARFDGDKSLRRRPMDRILSPLAQMGATVKSANGGLPCEISAASMQAIEYTLPKPSAQIKSAILLAGLGAEGETVIHEPIPCRDHTERMLGAFGAAVHVETDPNGGRVIKLPGRQKLLGGDIDVPGDPSSAAFLIAAALITEGSDVTVRNVLINPLRTGFFDTLSEMGGEIVYENKRTVCGEPVADIRARYSPLKGVEVPADRAPSMIDEYPILAVTAAFADGRTRMTGLEELRVKESDRIAAIEAGLVACGAAVESGRDWLRVNGAGGAVEGGATVRTFDDHRIAMSFLILGLAAQNPVEIDDASMIATSFPSFEPILRSLGDNAGPEGLA